MPYGISNQNGQVKTGEITAILDLAWKNGIDTLDTAKSYGTSEETIGNYLKYHSECSYKIITKISDCNGSIYDQFVNSTEKLTVCPTSILAHSAKLFLNEEFQSELQQVKDKQAFIDTGVSLYSKNEIDQVLESGFKPDIIQLPLNILDTLLYHRGILNQLTEEGIEIHARSAFLQGIFYLPETELNSHFSDAVPYLEKLKSIAAEANLTLAELSLLWLFSLEEVSIVVIGVDNAEQLEAHIKTIKEVVDPGVFEEALSIHYENEKILNPSLWTIKS